MSALHAVSPSARADRAQRVTLTRVLHAEWIKLRSIRSTVLALLFSAVAMVLLAFLNVSLFNNEWSDASAAHRATMDPVGAALGGWPLAQLLVGVIGTLAVTSEYTSGSIAATLAAAPRRTPVLIAKLVVPATVALLVMIPAALAAILVSGPLLPAGASIDLGDPAVLRAIAGVGIAMAGVCAIGAALGFILRSTAGAIGVLVVVLLLAPMFVPKTFQKVHPAAVFQSLITPDSAPGGGLSWPVAMALVAMYVGMASGAALWLLQRRDA